MYLVLMIEFSFKVIKTSLYKFYDSLFLSSNWGIFATAMYVYLIAEIFCIWEKVAANKLYKEGNN